VSVRRYGFARFRGGDGAPGVPGDPEDDECDSEADQRVADACAERDNDRARDDPERDEAVDAGVVSISDQRRAGEAASATQPHPGGEFIANEADDAGGGKHPQMGERMRMDQALDRLVERDASGDRDREHDGEAGKLLSTERAQEERDPERDRSKCVAAVVDQVGEQRDRAGEGEDCSLCAGRQAQEGEADRDGADTRARANDRTVDQAVRVPMLAISALVLVGVRMLGVVAQEASSNCSE
jgi:hypothetical protein